MRFWGCGGCEARGGEIKFLRERVETLESQLAAQADAKAEITRLRVAKPGAGPGPRKAEPRPALHPFLNRLNTAGHMTARTARVARPRPVVLREKEK